MAISLYDTTVGSYLRTLGAVDAIMEKAESHEGIDLDAIVTTQLRDDMLPFLFQVVSVAHHSRGAIEGVRAGLFGPPPDLGPMNFAQLRTLVQEAAAELSTVSAEEVEGFVGNPMTFKAGEFEVPFTAENFLLSFSLPNFYFHATTTYAILRMAGVPLGKLDFLGAMPIGN